MRAFGEADPIALAGEQGHNQHEYFAADSLQKQ
jgi:hypothetical protein